jgi:FkbM family methyltransferase
MIKYPTWMDTLLLKIKVFCAKFGIDIKKYMPGNCYWASLERMLAYHEIDLVLDIGANMGQFASMLRQSGYKGQIVSFEPLFNAHKILLNKSAADPLWTIAPRMAIGEKDGEISINISANSVSSSVVDMLDSHLEVAPESHFIGSEIVPVYRLDSVAEDFVPATARAFLKIDTQGYESQVLAGASQLIPLLKGIQVELSLMPFYEGEWSFVDMVSSIKNMGFELYGFFDVFSDQHTGRMYQADGIFFRVKE